MTTTTIEVTGGVDTHRDTHHAAALDQIGRLLGTQEFPADPGALETRRPADLVKRSLLDEDEDRRTITATETTKPLTVRMGHALGARGLTYALTRLSSREMPSL